MSTAELPVLDEIQRLLVLSSYSFQPRDRRTKCYEVLMRAMTWAGLSEAELAEVWGDQLNPDYQPVLKRWYGTLIGMTHNNRFSDPPPGTLFTGAGDLGTADKPNAFPLYTECGLTPEGLRVAKQLLEQYPHLAKSEW